SLSMLTETVLDPKNDVCSDDKALNYIVSEQKLAVEKANDSSDLKALLGDEPVQVKKAEPVVIPAKEELVESKSSDYSTFLDAPEGYYTLNITTTEGLDAAKNYVSENALDKNSSYTYSFGPEMKSAKVIYGIFKSVKEANIAMESLPASVKANKPYIDNILKHQKLYAKYNK
ncbi:MAG: hypothetical protein IE890_02425, partial [Arcobacter sp.]|nr:hypothetical protein [Arcobacter sp.]